jgi:hypothetical protein
LGGGIGLLLGLTGAGGGILAVPALVLGMGYTLADARPIALIAIGLAALLGSVEGIRQGIVRYRAALWMSGIGLLMAPIGVWLAHRLPGKITGVLFSLLMAYTAIRLMRSLLKNSTHAGTASVEPSCVVDVKTGRFHWSGQCAVSLSGVGAIAGLLTGAFGVGGGFVIVPGLRRVADINVHSRVATSLMVIATISSLSALVMLIHGIAIPSSGMWFVCAAAMGTLLGRGASRHFSARPTQLLFCSVTLLAAVVMFFKSVS